MFICTVKIDVCWKKLYHRTDIICNTVVYCLVVGGAVMLCGVADFQLKENTD